MACIDDVHALCARLAPLGWRDALLAATRGTLDLDATSPAALAAALAEPLEVDRGRAGFEDLSPGAVRGIEPGRPAQSVLLHALASPRVHPTPSGAPSEDEQAYPTLAELDAVENLVYSGALRASDLGGLVVAVFAYQYRVASRTAHRRHADLTFSRTGVSRVGTHPGRYHPARRSFVVEEADPEALDFDPHAPTTLRVLPARYGAFLARRGPAGAHGTVQGGAEAGERFLFPIHKLFSGLECVRGLDLDVSFLEHHRNEKLRRLHVLPPSQGGLAPMPGFDLNAPPFVRSSATGDHLVRLEPVGASVLLQPVHGASLVRTASQRVGGRDRIACFRVPPSKRIVTSTLMVESQEGARLAPEYVSIRHRVDPDGPVDQALQDLNALPKEEFERLMRDGGYHAAHFVDDSCDGSVEAVVEGLDGGAPRAPALSLVTAPDFLPLADQVEVEASASVQRVEPLSRGTLPPDPSLPRPSRPSLPAFDRDGTMTRVVGDAAFGAPVSVLGEANLQVSFLPDGASNVFAPGWDVSRSRDGLGSFLTTSGLGSPFPEDAKLCAAIASFWPAVAPDNGRTFGNEPNRGMPMGNQLPMLDEELGFHPDHPRVSAGLVRPYPGWDGEHGPFFEEVHGVMFVNHVQVERSDYVRQALDGRLRVDLTARVQSEDLLARKAALDVAVRRVDTGSRGLTLVTFRRVKRWSDVEGAHPSHGPEEGGFLLELAELVRTRVPAAEVSRVRRKVLHRHLVQVSVRGTAHRRDQGTLSFQTS